MVGQGPQDGGRVSKVIIELRLKFLKNIGDFRNATADFLAAAFHVKNELKDEAGKGFVEGEAWTKLVRGLCGWFAGKGLRVAEAKSQINSKQSAFVAFVHALQSTSTFPNRFKLHMASEALPKSINDALKKHVPFSAMNSKSRLFKCSVDFPNCGSSCRSRPAARLMRGIDQGPESRFSTNEFASRVYRFPPIREEPGSKAQCLGKAPRHAATGWRSQSQHAI